MSNGLVKFLAQEQGITLDEAQKVCERRKNFRRYFKDGHKTIPINPEKFEEILIRIGRKKQKSNKEIKEVL